jgi:hypothetical protein
VSVLLHSHSASYADTYPRPEVLNAQRRRPALPSLWPPAPLIRTRPSTLFLDDNPAKAACQPYNHLRLYAHDLLRGALRTSAGLGGSSRRRAQGQGRSGRRGRERTARKGVKHAAAWTAAAAAHLSSSRMALPPRIPPDAPPDSESGRYDASLLLARREGRGLAGRRHPRRRATGACRAAYACAWRAARLGSRSPPDFTSRPVRRVYILYMSEFSRLDLHLHLWRRFDLHFEGVHLDAVYTWRLWRQAVKSLPTLSPSIRQWFSAFLLDPPPFITSKTLPQTSHCLYTYESPRPRHRRARCPRLRRAGRPGGRR